MSDKFDNHAPGLTSPAGSAQAVSPSDSTDLPVHSRAIYVGGGGSLAIELVGAAAGQPVTLQNVPSGSILPLRVRRVRATGTTATALVSLW